MLIFQRVIVFASLSLGLCGCGLYVPQKDPLADNPTDPRNQMSRRGKIESDIIANIRCEVTNGLYRAYKSGKVPWIAGWGTSVSLNLTWEDQSSVNPNLLFTTPIGSDLFSAGAGASGSAHATRNEDITFTYNNKTLLKEAELNRVVPGLSCSDLQDGVTVSSDLHIDEFIYDKASIAGGPEARTDSIEHPVFSTFQETLTFVVSFGGNVTPSWKFIRLSVNPSGQFLSATRTNTSVIIITLGPLEKPKGPGAPRLTAQAAIQHNAAVTGTSTAAAIRSQSN